ncbi:hypothetical protein ES332_A08G088500v1 [Gossypium tomentosum]|uniref:Uncharacterized protein n=1 Tax=Gossypium tomentosum TaxID=34277 RepID=A0A5D2PDB9_GOSTO|nr:hypothetical protein ES332_A08G088500v1 [Gossypium tomentosum]
MESYTDWRYNRTTSSSRHTSHRSLTLFDLFPRRSISFAAQNSLFSSTALRDPLPPSSLIDFPFRRSPSPPRWFVHATFVQSPRLGILIPFPISTTIHTHTPFPSPLLFDHIPVSSTTFHHHSYPRSTFNHHCSCRPPHFNAVCPYRRLCHRGGNVITYLSCWNFLHIFCSLAMRTYLFSPPCH